MKACESGNKHVSVSVSIFFWYKASMKEMRAKQHWSGKDGAFRENI
jgi:hypothetical protein